MTPGFRDGVRQVLPWLPTIAGIGLLLCMVIIAALRLMPAARDDVAAVPVVPGPATITPEPEPSPSSEPPPAPSAARPVYSSDPVTWSPSAHPPSSRPPSAHPPSSRPPPPPVTGRYGVLGSYDGEFIGEVLVGNSTTRPADWVVELRFPGNVGDLRTSWVESAPQAKLSRSGDGFVWRSGVPVEGGSSVALRFQFARTGTGDRPSLCTVNGSPCQ